MLQVVVLGHRDLLTEALLLDDAPQNVARLGELASDREDLGEQVRGWQEEACPNKSSFAFRWSGAPWIPLAIVWEAAWASDYVVAQGQNLPEDLVEARWHLRAGADLEPASNERPSTEEVSFAGYAMLSQSQFDRLRKGLRKIREDDPLVQAVEDDAPAISGSPASTRR